MPRGKRRFIFDSSITEAEVSRRARRKEITPEQFIEKINKRRKAVGKQLIYPEGAMSILSNRKLLMPTIHQSKLINTMAKRVIEKGEYKSIVELSRELGKENQSSVNEHLYNLKKKGFPVEIFFKEKSKAKASFSEKKISAF